MPVEMTIVNVSWALWKSFPLENSGDVLIVNWMLFLLKGQFYQLGLESGISHNPFLTLLSLELSFKDAFTLQNSKFIN